MQRNAILCLRQAEKCSILTDSALLFLYKLLISLQRRNPAVLSLSILSPAFYKEALC